MTITEFLEARIGEDEAEAFERSTAEYYDGGWSSEHVRRILAECSSKRLIISMHSIYSHGAMKESSDALLYALRAHASAYTDHPGYRPEWKA